MRRISFIARARTKEGFFEIPPKKISFVARVPSKRRLRIITKGRESK